MIIDGRKIAAEILKQLKEEVLRLRFKPKLIDVFVGSDPVIESYVNIKAKRAFETGIDFEIRKYPEDVSEELLVADIKKMNTEEKYLWFDRAIAFAKTFKQAASNECD